LCVSPACLATLTKATLRAGFSCDLAAALANIPPTSTGNARRSQPNFCVHFALSSWKHLFITLFLCLARQLHRDGEFVLNDALPKLRGSLAVLVGLL
jgi:hypothetical protein